MGQKHSKGKISQEDLAYLMKNTKHSKKEIKVSGFDIHDIGYGWCAGVARRVPGGLS